MLSSYNEAEAEMVGKDFEPSIQPSFPEDVAEEDQEVATEEVKRLFKQYISALTNDNKSDDPLEDLTEEVCKWPIGHPDEDSFYFCGRNSLKEFSYCKLHILYAFQPKGKKEDIVDKDEEVPKYIEKKIKSA